MPKQIAEDVKDARLQALQDELIRQQIAFNKSLKGTVIPVLFDRPGRHDGQVAGRSPWLQSVHVEGPLSLMGQIADVTITSATQNSLTGTLVQKDAA
jgi:tRNA-2-methylthio-N6-dimethylallyladenosine synthase